MCMQRAAWLARRALGEACVHVCFHVLEMAPSLSRSHFVVSVEHRASQEVHSGAITVTLSKLEYAPNNMLNI